jgi:hypothetical protein
LSIFQVVTFLHSEFISKHSEQEKEKSNKLLLSNIIPFAGSGLVGSALGFALKKILKRILIIVGFLGGMFFLDVQLLQKYVMRVLLIGISLEITPPHRSNTGPVMLTQLIYMEYFTRLEFLLVAAWGWGFWRDL